MISVQYRFLSVFDQPIILDAKRYFPDKRNAEEQLGHFRQKTVNSFKIENNCDNRWAGLKCRRALTCTHTGGYGRENEHTRKILNCCFFSDSHNSRRVLYVCLSFVPVPLIYSIWHWTCHVPASVTKTVILLSHWRHWRVEIYINQYTIFIFTVYRRL